MKLVLFYQGAEPSIAFCKRQLAKRYSLLDVQRDALVEDGPHADLMVYEAESIRQLQLQHGMVIIGPNAPADHLQNLSGDLTLVVSSQNTEQLERVSALSYPTIICGLSPKDTLTFSSLGNESSMISLQRTVQLNHHTIEPMEIPLLHQQNFDVFGALSAAAVVLAMDGPVMRIDF